MGLGDLRLSAALLSILLTAALFALALRFEPALVRASSGLPPWTGMAVPLVLLLLALRRRNGRADPVR